MYLSCCKTRNRWHPIGEKGQPESKYNAQLRKSVNTFNPQHTVSFLLSDTKATGKHFKENLHTKHFKIVCM
jgi:hypothetical protein